MTDEPGAARIKALIVDDSPDVASAIQRKLIHDGAEVSVSNDPLTTAAQLAAGISPWDVVILDVQMPGLSGYQLLQQFRASRSAASIVMLSADDTASTAAACMRAGAYDYIPKPFSMSELVAVVRSAAQLAQMRRRLATEVSDRDELLVGRSPGMRQLRAAIARVASQDISLLIQGESGTGKELVARSVHRASARSNAPFVALNCGAIAESLIDSELFGHCKGAFTGATTDRDGVFVEADGGTLFLDEIGDMPLAAQARLLRVLQEGEVRALGATGTRAVDVRVIAATHVDLEQAVSRERFRQDLFYRLNVVVLAVPPLRERVADIPDLAGALLRKHGGPRPPTLAGSALETLVSYRWPGNVRELENAILHALAMRHGDEIDVAALPRAVRERPRGSSPLPRFDIERNHLPLSEAKRLVAANFEREYLLQVMERAQGSVAEGARIAGLDRTNFRRLLQRHNIDPDSFK